MRRLTGKVLPVTSRRNYDLMDMLLGRWYTWRSNVMFGRWIHTRILLRKARQNIAKYHHLIWEKS